MERERAVWQCLLATDCKLFAYQKLPARAITKIILYENEQLSREKEREKEREREREESETDSCICEQQFELK